MTTARFFVIGDIHGEYEQLQKLMALVQKEGEINLAAEDELVQLGDKCDRGPDTHKVFEYFRVLKGLHPENVFCLWGNHEDMMMNASQPNESPHERDLFYMNGGGETSKSYLAAAGMAYSRSFPHFREALEKTGHMKFMKEDHDLFMETEEYFFCHAPIPKERYRQRKYSPPIAEDWKRDKDTLIWSYHGEDMPAWVDPDPCGGKICVYGHIHGLKYNPHKGKVESPGVRKYGNSYLIDTGAGCHPNGYLTCLELPAKKVYTSRGETYVID